MLKLIAIVLTLALSAAHAFATTNVYLPIDVTEQMFRERLIRIGGWGENTWMTNTVFTNAAGTGETASYDSSGIKWTDGANSNAIRRGPTGDIIVDFGSGGGGLLVSGGGTTQPVLHVEYDPYALTNGSATINGQPLTNDAVIVVTASADPTINLGATNTPSAGQMLVASDGTKTNLNFVNVPATYAPPDSTNSIDTIFYTNNAGYLADASYNIALPQLYRYLIVSVTMKTSADAVVNGQFNSNTNNAFFQNYRDASAATVTTGPRSSHVFGRLDDYTTNSCVTMIYNYTSAVQRCTTTSAAINYYAAGSIAGQWYINQCGFLGPCTNLLLSLSSGSFTNCVTEVLGVK